MPRMKEVWTPLKWFGVRYFKDSENNAYYKKVGENHRHETRPFWKYKRFGLAAALMLLSIPGYVGYQVVMDKASEKLVNEMTNQVSKEEIGLLLKDPTVQEMIEKELGTKKAAELLQGYEVEASGIATSGISDEDMTFKQGASSSVEKEGEAGSSGNDSTVVSNGETAQQKESTPVSGGQNQQSANSEQQASGGKSNLLTFSSRQEATKFVMSKFSMSEISNFAKMAQGGLTAEEKVEIKAIVESRLSAEEYNALKLFGLVELSKQQ